MKPIRYLMNILIISYASKGREDYHKGLKRLIDSCIPFGYDLRMYSPDMSEREYNGVPILIPHTTPHSEVPYKFKFDLIQQAYFDGYKRIVWLDSSMVVKRDLNELFDGSGGWCFHNLGHPLYKWIGDEAVKNLVMDEKELYSTPQTWGGCFGLDFNNYGIIDLLSEILYQSNMGSFNECKSYREGFVAHRHDQSVLSVLFNRYKIKMYDYGTILTGSHCYTENEYGNNPYLNHLAI